MKRKQVKFTPSDDVAKILEQIPSKIKGTFINNCIIDMTNANSNLIKWCSQRVEPKDHAREFSLADLGVLPIPKKSKVIPTPKAILPKHDFGGMLEVDDEFR